MACLALDILTISDVQAESGILATAIKHPEFLANITYLQPGMFSSVENGCLYWCIQKLFEEGITNIDAFNMSNALNSNRAVKKKIEEYNINNIQEFLELSRCAARDTLQEYKLMVDTVVSLAYKRELYKRTVDIQHLCLNEENDLQTINNKTSEVFAELSTKYIIGTDSVRFGEKAREVWKNICDNRNPDGTVGFPSKIKAFNEYFTFCKKELVLLTARMKKGKSAYFMNEAIYLSVHNGVPTLYIDTEMSDEQFMKRMIANITGIEVKRVENGRYSEEEAHKIEDAIKLIEKAPLVHEYMPDGFDQSKVIAICQQWKNKINVEFLIYDYLKFDETESAFDSYNRLGRMCDVLKNLVAGKMDIAALAGAQLNRQNEVGSSDKIEMYCSTSIRWFEKTSEMLAKDGIECGNYGASIVLNRNGSQTGEDEYIDILFSGTTMRITDAKKQHDHAQTPFS